MIDTPNLPIEECFKILGNVYDEIAIEMSERIPGYVAVGVDIVTFRKLLWKKYRINRGQFAEMLQQIRDHDHNDEKCHRQRVKLFGGPIYLKDNWVECDGRHWLLIEVETEDHTKRMAPHRG